MINLLIGRPGGGKSYEAVVYHIIPAVQAGRKVITNLPLNIAHFQSVFGDGVTELIKIIETDMSDHGNINRPFSKPEDYKDDWRNESGQGPLIVVDEAHLVLPISRTSVEVLEFLSLHRHHGVDILLITQSDRKIHKDVRDMVQLQYRCSKNTALGSEKTYTRKVQDGCRGEVVNTSQRTYKASYFPFYQSHTASNGAVSEATAADIKPIWQHWSFIGGAVCLVFVVGMFATGNVKSPLSAGVKEQPEPVKQLHIQPDGSPTPVPEVPAKKRTNGKHPLADFDLYVTGAARQIALRPDKTFDLDLSFDVIYLEAYKDEMKQFAVNSKELRKLGYNIHAIGKCVYSLEYHDFDSIVVCNESRGLIQDGPLSTVTSF
ncbi:zonular occludens toxin domain-containing protein [Photobacterium halotolerans]|uniref:Assembly protein n=1 Tax=Photobacterium halotolerans TaxID=265726 RepID=A0A7X4W9L1_9GAMM|nr:zonular occludens toxin domain-containing protein [Photobacterium halotolerans]NAW64327.1 assembly protein [Photobacterium halotolerans]